MAGFDIRHDDVPYFTDQPLSFLLCQTKKDKPEYPYSWAYSRVIIRPLFFFFCFL